MMPQRDLLEPYFKRLDEFSTLRWVGRVIKSVGHVIESEGPYGSVGEGCGILTAARVSWQHGSAKPQPGTGPAPPTPRREERTMDPMGVLALAAAAFLATHYVSSTPFRPGLVGLLGDKAYLGAYVAVSFATLGWMIWAYARAPFERLWVGDEFRAWVVVLMPVACVLLACGLMTTNPSAVRL